MFKSGANKFGSFSTTTSGFGNDKTSMNSTATTVKQTATKDGHKVTANDYVPKRFGLKFDPPSIILEYLIPSSGKLYHHKMKLLKLKGDSDTFEMIDYLKNKHAMYFLNNKISESQLINLIEKLKKRVASETGSTFVSTGGFGGSKKENNASGGLGKLAPLASNTIKTNKTNSFWESETDTTKGNSSLSSKQSMSSSTGFQKKEEKKPETKKQAGSANGFWDFEDIGIEDDDDDNGKVDYHNTNLNKLSKAELDKHKAKMDVHFSKNQKKPGDKDFVYDKQEEFDPQEENEWDEELEI